jgi:hypothetical protein
MTLCLLHAGCEADDHARRMATKTAPGDRALAIDPKSICWLSNLGDKDTLDDRAS